MGTTPTYHLRYPELPDPADVPTDMHELALDVEAALTTSMASVKPAFLQGTEAARPAASAANNQSGYYATDSSYLYVSNGSAWLRVAAVSDFLQGPSTSRPASSAAYRVGTAWYETNTGLLWISNGSGWGAVYPPATTPPPGTEIDYVELRSTFYTTSGSFVPAIQGNWRAYDGVTRVRVEVWAPAASVWGPNSADTGQAQAILRDGAPVCGFSNYNNGPSVGSSGTAHAVFYDTPAAGSHHFAYAVRSDGTGTGTWVWGGSGGGNALPGPGFVRVTRA